MLAPTRMPDDNPQRPRRGTGRVTLQHVARACGVSPSAVSIVLNQTPLSLHMAEDTRRRVQETAERLGYRPNILARFLRKQRSEMVGIMVFDIADPFCTQILQGIQEELLATDYLPVIMDAQNQREHFERYLELLVDRRVDGVIVVANWLFVQIDTLRDFEKNGLPAVMVGREYSSQTTSSVLVDNEQGGYLALEHLYRLGHRRISVIRGPASLQDSERRWRGIRRFAAEVKLRLDPALVRKLPDAANPFAGYEGGHAAVDSILREGRQFTAVLAFDDLTACGAIRALREHDLLCPDDVSVIGFDDVPFAALTMPRLTTVRQHMKELGALSARTLLEAIRALIAADAAANGRDSGRTPRKAKVLPPQFIQPHVVQRESTASLPAPSERERKRR